jgi:ABC-type nickel/cobalt efflux system permease component RcnA
MDQHQDGVWAVLAKSFMYVLAWLGSWKVGEVQALVGIASGLIVAGFAGTQWWVLWRDKVRGR